MQTVYDFTAPSAFTLVNTAIVSNLAKLAIIPNPGQLFSQDFSSSSGFTYNSALAEFTAGRVEQKDQRPTGAQVGATYSTSKNLNWSQGGSLTGTDTGTPIISGGKLACLGGGNNSVRYTATEIGSTGDIGALRVRYTPNYSGTPASNYNIVSFGPTAGNNGRMVFFHSSTGTVRVTAYNSAGTAVHSAVAMGAVWSPVAGTEYELEFNWDTATGLIRWFVNGVLGGSSPNTAFNRGTSSTTMYVGAGTVYTAADASYRDLILFNAVQHTAGYTPGYTVPINTYLTSNVDLPNFSYSGLGTVLAVESSVITEGGSPRYVVGGMYWNGSAWVASNGTYAQANTSATVIANLPSINVTGATSIPVRICFTDTNTQSYVDLIEVIVTGQKYAPTGSIEVITPLTIQEVLLLASTYSTPANTSIVFGLKVDAVLKYWNGSAWVVSDGSAGQLNTLTDINDNVSTLLSQNSAIQLFVRLSSTSNTATPEVTDMTINYTFGALDPDGPDVCLVWGYVKDITGAVVPNAKITFSIETTDETLYAEASDHVISILSISVLTDENGYFETNLIRSSEYENPNTVYHVTIKTGKALSETKSDGSHLDITVPDLSEINITELISAA